MTGRRLERFRRDERATVTGLSTSTIGSNTVILVLALLGLPPLVAMVGVAVRRGRGFQYVFAAATAILTTFLLTATVQFPPILTVLAILAIIAGIGLHVNQFRDDRVDFVVVASIYVTAVSLACVLLFGVLVSLV